MASRQPFEAVRLNVYSDGTITLNGKPVLGVISATSSTNINGMQIVTIDIYAFEITHHSQPWMGDDDPQMRRWVLV